jgi:hypothetical protein
VTSKIPKEELPPTEMIPRYLETKERDNVLRVPTKITEQGEISLELIGKEPR